VVVVDVAAAEVMVVKAVAVDKVLGEEHFVVEVYVE